MKVLLFANTDWYLYNFRISLAEALRKAGWEVVLVSPPGEYSQRLESLGFRWVEMPFSTRSMNPFHELGIIFKLLKLYRRERPHLVHQFTIKCVLYGSIATRMIGGIKVVNAVPGLGYVFTNKNLKTKLIRPFVKFLYRYALGGNESQVIFQNEEDQINFVSNGLVPEKKTTLIRGSGVNTEQYKSLSKTYRKNEIIKILFASRLLKEKGIFELVQAVESLKQKGQAVKLYIAGDLYPDNPSSLSQTDVSQLREKDFIRYLGHVDNIKDILENVDIVALPSYYGEGTPRILIEAASMEKPLVAADIAGCRGLVVDGKNGYLVPAKDIDKLAEAIEQLVVNPERRKDFGLAGRVIVLNEFDERIVIERTMEVYRRLNC